MIKDKGDKVGNNRNNIKEEIPDNDSASHVSRAGAPSNVPSGTGAGGLKEADEAPRVKLERNEETSDLPTAEIKTEMDGLIDSEGDPTKSPSCDMVGPGSLKSERLSSDSNDILDPQTGLRGPALPLQESCQRSNSTSGVNDGLSCRVGDGVQPLPSNVISKQPSSMEVQYSQQQSQIFVFSTSLANKGAESVIQGQFTSMIAFHCAQPGTKKYLEKNPLKMGQFNKQNNAQWLSNLSMIKNRGAIRGSGAPNMTQNMMVGPNCVANQMNSMMGANQMGNMHIGLGMGQMGPNMNQVPPNMAQLASSRMGGPGQGGQAMMMKGNSNQMPGIVPTGMGSGMNSMDAFSINNGSCSVMDGIGDSDLSWETKTSLHPNGINNVGSCNANSGGPHMNTAVDSGSQGGAPSSGSSNQDCSGVRGGGSPAELLKLPNLQGVKIPDENLTPQQRAHREEQLATIRKMHQMLFPESGMGSGVPNPNSMIDPSQNPNDQNSIGGGPNMPPNSLTGGSGIAQNNVSMNFNPNQMMPMGPGCSIGPGGMGPMGSSNVMGPNGPSCAIGSNGPIGNNGPVVHNSLGPMGGNMSMGPNGMMGPSGPIGQNAQMASMGPNGPMGPGGMMGPNGPMGPGTSLSPMGSCVKPGMRNACGAADMKQSMCADVHLNRQCSGPITRISSMGSMKPCMMGGARMLPGTNINTMNGGMMMDSTGMGDCSNPAASVDHMNLGPMCDDFGRNRNMGNSASGDGHKLGLRSPRSPNSADLDWQKLHHQFFDQDKQNMDGELGGQVKSPCSDRGGMSSGNCLPPPPYGTSPLHRSASVPIATQSPSQCSNIQMPMSAEASRVSSALNSPAECGTSRTSSSTSGANTGPLKGLPKNPLEGGPEEGMFVRTLQCLAAQQQKQQPGPTKEANLMPVPSPKQIQYLNTFEGQELTIQKQPNTSLKENMNTNQKSPGMMPGTPEAHSANSSGSSGAPVLERANRYSLDHSPGFPGSNNPQTPNSNIANDKQRPSPSSSRSVQDPNSKTPVRDTVGPNTPSQNLNQGPYAPNATNQSTNSSMTSPSHPMIGNHSSTTNNINSNPNNLNNNSNNLNSNPNLVNNSNTINNSNNINNSNVLNNPSSGTTNPNNNFNTANKNTSCPVSIPSSINSTNVNSNNNISNVNAMSNPGMNMTSKISGGLEDSPTGMTSGQIGISGVAGPENSGVNRTEHAPLVPGSGNGSSFDPISSLTQMSQQLTGGPSHPHGGHPHPHHHPALLMQDMGCHMEGLGSGMGPMDNMMGPNDFPPEMNMSPKMGGGPMGPMGSMGADPSMMNSRLGGKMAPFNGANVQVKASAPNTIQYLPTRPQLPCSAGPRGPPSLDFLQRVTNPMHMDSSKPSTMNMQYFPGGPCGGPIGHGGSPTMGPRMDMGEQMGPIGSMRPQGPMMGPMRGNPGMLRMPHYPGSFNSPPKLSDPFASNMGPNPSMMCNPSFRPAMMKGAPMRIGAPNTSQPLPASMGGPGSFKSSQNFVVPSTADPNYAQQFHNFQQQLYATGTRSQAQPGPHYPGGYMPK